MPNMEQEELAKKIISLIHAAQMFEDVVYDVAVLIAQRDAALADAPKP